MVGSLKRALLVGAAAAARGAAQTRRAGAEGSPKVAALAASLPPSPLPTAAECARPAFACGQADPFAWPTTPPPDAPLAPSNKTLS